MNLLKLLLLASVLISVLGMAQIKEDYIKNKGGKSFDEMVVSSMKKYSIPGLSAAVIKNGEIDQLKYYGVKNEISKEPVNDSTIFIAASLTKPVFAYLVLKLYDEGRIDIDVPLYTYIPVEVLEKYFIGHPVNEKGFNYDWFKKITGRMVLSHSTGLPMYSPSKPFEISFEPGTQFRYSPYAFGLLEIAVYFALNVDVGSFTGTELNDIMKAYIFDPLDMNHSSMIWKDRFEDNAVVGHNLFMTTSGKYLKNTRASSASSLYTTAEDYARFVIAVMNREGLKKETSAEMLKPQISLKEEDNFWGLGLGLEKTEDGYYFWQWGDYGYLKSFVLASGTKKDGIVFFTNSYYGLCIADDLVKTAIGGKHPLFNNSIMKNYIGPIKKWTRAFCIEGVDKGIELYNLEKKDTQNPISESLITAIGYEFIYEKRFDDACSVFRLAAQEYRKSYQVLEGLAEAYIKDGRLNEAETTAQKILELDPGNEKARRLLNEIRRED